LSTYKYGWKTSYYQNTYDAKKDVDEPTHNVGWQDNVEETKPSTLQVEEDCDSCTI
jgi:ribonucleoside-diphosphate reductase alpha chain